MQEVNLRVPVIGGRGVQEGIDTFNGSYVHSLDRIIYNMKRLIAQGYEIMWSFNEKWCTINGKTFNISKIVWDARTHAVSL